MVKVWNNNNDGKKCERRDDILTVWIITMTFYNDRHKIISEVVLIERRIYFGFQGRIIIFCKSSWVFQDNNSLKSQVISRVLNV